MPKHLFFRTAAALSFCGVLAPTAVAHSNIAPNATVTSSPYVGGPIDLVTDGKMGRPLGDNTLVMAAPLPIRFGGVVPLVYEFTFPARAALREIRVFQHETRGRRPANSYVFEVDSDGDGAFDREIAREREGKGGRWFSYALSPSQTAYRLRFRTLDYPRYRGPNYGAAVISELEIYADETFPDPHVNPLPDAPLLAVDERRSRPLSTVSHPAKPWHKQFARGIFAAVWNYWSAGKYYDEQRVRSHLALLKQLNVNRVWLYPSAYVRKDEYLHYVTVPENPYYAHYTDRLREHGAAWSSKMVKIAPFPSRVVLGHRENILKKLIEDMHRNNIGVIANEAFLPYGLYAWDFPRVTNLQEYPSVRCSSFVRDASTQLYRELMESGVDGLALGGDEFFLRSHPGTEEDVASVCRDQNGKLNGNCSPTCRELFQRRHDIDFPLRSHDISARRARWQVFQYERLAGLFSNYAQMMRSINPQAVITSLFRAGEANRTAYGIAHDILGSAGMVEEMSSNPYWSHNNYLGHYFFANETKKLIGASRTGRATVTLQATPHFDRNGYEDPLMLYGPAFSALMHGVSGINFYKQDYLFAGGRNDAGPWVEKVFNLIVRLEQKGLLDYQVPKKVALLYSRASEDWWQLLNPQDPVLAAEATLQQNAVMEVLFRNGIPFDLHYLDQPTSLDDLGDYALVILAYPYSVSSEAVAMLERAIAKGSKVLSFGRRGEVDAFGTPHPTPLLVDVAEIWHLETVLDGSNFAAFSERLMPVIRRSLATDLPLVLNAGGKDVECSLLSKGANRMLFCLNWEKQAVGVNLGIALPEGTYRLSSLSLDRESAATVGGRAMLRSQDFERFRLVLAPGEARVLHVVPSLERSR